MLALHGLCLFFWARHFARLYRPIPPSLIEQHDLPRVTVLLPVRGADPFLVDCLHGLLNQDYPDYEVCVIVDSPHDAAWGAINRVQQDYFSVPVRVVVLHEPRPTCSLKLSALLQAIGELDDTCAAVALIDADVIPHAGWLRELAAPLREPEVGATTGIRWYAPCDSRWGTLVRYLWNASASIHMAALEIPWGGSLAIRTDVLRRSGLLEQWALSLFEDTACYDALHRLGLKIRFVAAATMVNRETIGMKSCFHFIRRQLLDARLYHPRWTTVLTLGLLSSVAIVVAFALTLNALAQQNAALAIGLGAGLTLYFLGMTSILQDVEGRMATVVGTAARPSWFKTLFAIPLTQAVYVVALVSACIVRRISWRGIAYEFDGPLSVRLIEYRPCEPETDSQQNASVT